MSRAVAGVAGRPIGHSLSPAIHRAWIAAAGLDADYRPFEPEDAADFDRLLETGRAGRIRGLNVTAPYKEQALARADVAGPAARACGSANLLLFEAGRIHADSTDGAGLLAALAEQAPQLRLRGAGAVVLGAGGAARAAVAALREAGAAVAVINRTQARAEALAAELDARVGAPEALAEAALVVNALSVPPAIDIDALPAGAVLMDMTYRPLETAFLAAGRARGLTTVDGLAMLIGQARPSFEALFGRPPPPVDVRAVALAAMEARP
ncbi:MAG: shikimate dehydrogenase [Brevundimonas sp.]|uniref:shikimate dehydrogenase family protein n=1 Tax=Brevundimonas sp. TaxID=1871086 RepID=UPI0017B8EF65|nr:shikimate dehydrogenase [Brevundimonas sp.]MBA4803625.1 shikimate dehydrogenase [Brevundimonas sp.]